MQTEEVATTVILPVPIAASVSDPLKASIGASNSEKVREQTRKVFENELAQTLTETVGSVLKEYVSRPYQ